MGPLIILLLTPFSVALLAQTGPLEKKQETPPGSATEKNPAQDQETKQLADMSIEELSNVQVYSASKHTQSISVAPASVTVITRDEIQKHGYRTLADILRGVRGLYITYDGVYSYLGIRGFGRPSDLNTRILLLIDGHRINDNVYDQAMLGTEFWVDVDLIERVEVIRGPSSSLYGANAFFGIINVITRKYSDVQNLELSFEPASLDTYKGRATYSHSFHGLETLLSASFSSRLGDSAFDAGSNGTTYPDADETRNVLLSFGFRGFTLQAVSGRRLKHTGASFGSPADDTRSIDQHHYIDLTYRRALGSDWNLLNRTYYDRYDFDGLFLFTPGSLSSSYAIGDWWGDEIQMSHTFFKKHSVTFGAELRDNLKQYQKNYNINPFVVTLLDERTSRDWGLYAQDEYKILPALTFSMGIRLDKYGDFDWTVNPRVGLIYQARQQSVFKLLYGTAFRPPNAFETVNESPTTPALIPESIKSLEGIWEQGYGARFRSTVDVFRNSISHLITADANIQFSNARNARSTGAEFELETRFASGFTGIVSYGYTQAKDVQTGQILSNSPSHLAKVSLSVPLLTKHLFASMDAQYEGSRTTDAGTRLGGFPVFNFTVFTPEWRHLEFSASVYNLFDKNYAYPATFVGSLPQEGRAIRGKITWRIGNRPSPPGEASSKSSTDTKVSSTDFARRSDMYRGSGRTAGMY